MQLSFRKPLHLLLMFLVLATVASAARTCHFHAGVEHCTGKDDAPAEQPMPGETPEEHAAELAAEEAAAEAAACSKVDREYNIPLRIGALFVIMATSSLAVFSPILASRFTKMSTQGILFTILKQFGTGVIISTAFVHLYTHATLLFASECVGELGYEGTVGAIAMAGVFIAFFVEYIGHRMINRNRTDSSDVATLNVKDNPAATSDTTVVQKTAIDGHFAPGHAEYDTLNVTVLEFGIVFHSILIGITLVMAGDSGFLPLFAVIIFHQMFEGLALGSLIASLPPAVALRTKLIMASIFGFITPAGMAIGILVRNSFNGNDRATLLTLGTMDALSAGILLFVGIVEMLAKEWMHGYLSRAGVKKSAVGMAALISGAALMSLLGKWA